MCQNDLCFPFHFYQTPLGVAVLEGLIKTLSSRHRCTKDRNDSSATGVALISAEIQPESSGFLGILGRHIPWQDKNCNSDHPCLSKLFVASAEFSQLTLLLGPDLSVHQWIEACLSSSEKAHQVDRVIHNLGINHTVIQQNIIEWNRIE